MKYTKKYPIHPKPEKQFSGASIFADGGQLPEDTLTHRDSVAHQADKILKYEQLKGGPGGAPLSYYSDPKYKKMLMDNVYPEVSKIMPNASAMEKGEAMDFVFNAGYDKNSGKITKDPRGYALQEYYRQNDPSKLDASGNWVGRKGTPYSFDTEYNNTIGKLPENERRILMNKGRDWYYKNTNNPAPGVLSPDYNATWYGRIHNTNDFKEFDPNNPKFKPTKKAFGGFKYPNGGSFYNASNINTTKPQVNTVPSSYTEQFNGNSSSGMTKDGKLPGSTPNVRSTSNYQQTANAITQYGTAAANIAGEITSSTLDTSYKNPESDKFAAVDTTMSNIPVIGQFYQLGNAANEPIKDWQADATKREGAKSSEAVTATALSGAIDPMDGWKQNVAAYEAGNISKDEAIGNLVAQFFLPGFANQSVNQANEEARKKKQLNTSLLNAQNVDSASRNFSAFGGYKNKFPYGGHVNTFNLAQMAYGGNMKSEVTGKSYLKDQVVNFDKPGFKTHAEGGVTLDPMNEVEKDEVIFGDYVYSNRLKHSSGKTYAQVAKGLLKQIGK